MLAVIVVEGLDILWLSQGDVLVGAVRGLGQVKVTHQITGSHGSSHRAESLGLSRRSAKETPDPRMLNGFARSRALLWVEHEALLDEVKEQGIVRRDCLLNLATVRDAQNAILGVLDQVRTIVRVEVVILLPTLVDHALREHAEQLHDELKLLLLVVSREQRLASVELGEDAAERPHVDLLGVSDPEDDLRGAVIARLHVGVHLFIHEAARSKVNDFEQLTCGVHTENILRLQVTVNDLALFEEEESFKELCCVRPDLLDAKAVELILFQVFKQVSVEQLEDEALVLSEMNMLHQSHDVVLVVRVLVHEELEQFTLLLRELVVNLRVPVDFNSNSFAFLVVDGGDDLRKTAFAEDFNHLESVQDVIFGLEHVVTIFVIRVRDSVQRTCTRRYVVCIVNFSVSQRQLE